MSSDVTSGMQLRLIRAAEKPLKSHTLAAILEAPRTGRIWDLVEGEIGRAHV